MRRTASVLRKTGEPGLSRAAAGNEALADHIEAIEKEVLKLRAREARRLVLERVLICARRTQNENSGVREWRALSYVMASVPPLKGEESGA